MVNLFPSITVADGTPFTLRVAALHGFSVPKQTMVLSVAVEGADVYYGVPSGGTVGIQFPVAYPLTGTNKIPKSSVAIHSTYANLKVGLNDPLPGWMFNDNVVEDDNGLYIVENNASFIEFSGNFTHNPGVGDLITLHPLDLPEQNGTAGGIPIYDGTTKDFVADPGSPFLDRDIVFVCPTTATLRVGYVYR